MDLPVNRFKRRLLEGRHQTGLWITIPDPTVVEALAGAGYDWITLDTEHTPVEVSSVLPLLQAAAASPVSCVVRPSVNDTALIKRHLDQGAQTILLPFVQSPEEARAAVRAVRYPPEGVRGAGGTVRAAAYGRIADYVARANAEICLILQVETVEALARLEEIAQVPGVDAVFIGPNDLATSMGHPGDPGHPEAQRAVLGAIARMRAIGRPVGVLSTDPAIARACIAAGSAFTAVAVDMGLLIAAAEARLSALRTG
ncbi:MAG: HpcH/HpaI aldolase/citrate lyase family protein [Rhodobacteraceae bacterium]|nr:HpcH/HpaI aldolase/citrate lyase family protein [Paracoccaceae bacterium]